jgi:hypothetical protein
MTERHCDHCGYWYPIDDWTEDEEVLRLGPGEVEILRTVECPGCRATSDAHAPKLRSRT